MMIWRLVLFFSALLGSVAGYGMLLWTASPGLQTILWLLLSVFMLGTAAISWRYREQLTWRLFSANLSIGAVVLTAAAGAIRGAMWLSETQSWPQVAPRWQYLLIGLVGVSAAFFAWTRARRKPAPPAVVAPDTVEPPPTPTPRLQQAPRWEALHSALRTRDDRMRLRQLSTLQRLFVVTEDGELSSDERLDAVRRTLHQEARRLVSESVAAERESAESDALTQAASLLEWGVQKLPELSEIDVSDLIMAKTVADIRALSSSVEHTFVDHRRLLAIHPINRETANQKCDQRAAAARDALPLLRENGMRLSEELIGAHEALSAFRSVTGFQVVSMGGGKGYVTFEGNGRREALRRAFGDDEGVQIEVRLFRFDDPTTRETIIRRVQRVRRWKNVTD